MAGLIQFDRQVTELDFGFSTEEESFRAEVCSFLDAEMSAELIKDYEKWTWGRVPEEGISQSIKEFNLKLGEHGWLGISWPKEYGGQAGSIVHEFILIEELARRRLVIPNYTAVCMVGPTLLRYGSEDQKKFYLNKIARGEIEFALGYTEPDAGSDLASLGMRAVEKGDYYIVNGQKTFNTACHCADYHWLAARTDLSVSKHKGISLFIVDFKSPGITIRPLKTMAGGRTNEVFYDEVKVPKGNLVGIKNKGFEYLITALDFERTTIFLTAELVHILAELIEFAKTEGLNKDTLVRQRLSQIAIDIEAGRLLVYRVISMMAHNQKFSYESAMAKMFNTETWQRMVITGIQILGLYSQLKPDSAYAKLGGTIEGGYQAAIMPTFGAGANELMRNIIATRGLKLPPS